MIRPGFGRFGFLPDYETRIKRESELCITPRRHVALRRLVTLDKGYHWITI